MKHLKNRIKQFTDLYKDTKSQPIESHLEKFADYLDPRNNPDTEQLKKQKHYQNLKEQHRKLENDYVSDFVSVSHKNNYKQDLQNEKDNQNTQRKKTKVNYENFDPMNPQKSEKQFQNIESKQNQMNQNNQKSNNGYQYSFTEANEDLKNPEKQQAKEDYYKQFQESLKNTQNTNQYTKESEVKNNFNQQSQENQTSEQNKQNENQEEREEQKEDEEGLSMAEKMRRKYMNPPKEKEELNVNNEQETQESYQNAKIQEQTGGQVPFMITRSMKISLLEIGYSPDQIRSMRPADAHYALLEHAQNQSEEQKPKK